MTPAQLLKDITLFQGVHDERAKYIGGLWKDFGREVRTSRKDNGISLAAFARGLAVSSTMVSYLESGTRQWNLEMAKRAVALLGKRHG